MEVAHSSRPLIARTRCAAFYGQVMSSVNEALRNRVQFPGSKIRLNGGRFLAYAVVDSIVDEMHIVMDYYMKLVGGGSCESRCLFRWWE
jgi:5-carboxymethyl-2-hydroxymuconate isomerase